MTDKNLTDNEILKALEICSTYKGKCTDCPAFVKVDRSNCKQVLLGAIEIITRQQAENETLKALNGRLVVLGDRFRSELKTAKAEAYKEFSEEIFELFPADKCNTVISRVTVKHILKELEGEDNA